MAENAVKNRPANFFDAGMSDKLLESDDNPAPPGARVVTVRTTDGVLLRGAYWPAVASPPCRGTILLLQGRAEFIEKYFEVVGELLARGFAVATFDWRGQGGSGRSLMDGRKGHIRHFDDFRHDLDAFAEQVLDRDLPKPVFGLAHSMGGCIGLIAAAEGWLPAERLVATTPMIALSIVRRPRLARALARLLAALGFGDRFVPGGKTHSISTEPFPGNRLSRDERRYARNAAVAQALGAGAIGSPTIGWITAAYEAMARFDAPGFGSRVKCPTLVIGAGDDPVCATNAAEAFARALGPGSAYVLIPESRHEVLMEGDAIRAAFWDAFDAFIPGPDAPADGSASASKPVQHFAVQPLVATGHD